MIIGFLDTETTGKFDEKHRIIELSIRVYEQVVNGVDISYEEINNHLWRFNPERNIDARAFAVHKITLEELKHEPVIKEKIPEIISILESLDLLVHHNGDDFDIPFLKMEAERNGFTMPEIKTFDTINCNFASEIGKSPSLRELCWCFDVEYDETKAHAGDYDTDVLAKVYIAMIKDKWIERPEKKKEVVE